MSTIRVYRPEREIAPWMSPTVAGEQSSDRMAVPPLDWPDIRRNMIIISIINDSMLKWCSCKVHSITYIKVHEVGRYKYKTNQWQWRGSDCRQSFGCLFAPIAMPAECRECHSYRWCHVDPLTTARAKIELYKNSDVTFMTDDNDQWNDRDSIRTY